MSNSEVKEGLYAYNERFLDPSERVHFFNTGDMVKVIKVDDDERPYTCRNIRTGTYAFIPAKGLLPAPELTTGLAPLDRQVGGGHYKDMAIQPITFIMANKLSFCAGNVVKYICRADKKGGLEDLEKAKHYIEFLIAEKKEQSD